ncbi:MAG: PTS sugar transporter subunit IIA [Deltaproteobacteria bacterium]|uniref:PTS sugar transporter subunit IIA n=1 Tax=Candidatus Zymogenus saltonus TaxID=2844893 RepID=A0A9D8KHV5_9DELT|nr:PTS sugar transporter subunit IIA [Candidatus Zymogenus saltonus]
MVGIVIVSHLNLAAEVLKTAELIVGKIDEAIPLSLDPKKDVEILTAEIKDAIKKVNSGAGVIILTDMFGGTPSNLAMSFLGDEVEVVSGVNLPMIIKIAMEREGVDLKGLALKAKEAGRDNINVATEFLSKKK